MNETDKRLKIISNLFEYFDKDVFEAILLVGSMSYGKYFSVNEKSDIDLIFIINKEKLDRFSEEDFFMKAEYFDEEKVTILKEEKADGFWIDQRIEGVLINLGIYLKSSLEKYCELEKTVWKISTETESSKWDKERIYRGSDGQLYRNLGKLEKNAKLYIKSNDIFRGKAFISNVFAGNLFTAEILHDKNNSIQKNINKFKYLFYREYKLEGTINILEYVLNKMSENQKAKFLEKVKQFSNNKITI